MLLGHVDVVGEESAIECGAAYPENFRGLCPVSLSLLEGLKQLRFWFRVMRCLGGWRQMVTPGAVEFLGKISRHQTGSAGADYGKFDSAFQLSDVAGPGVGHKHAETVGVQISDGFACGRTDLAEQCLYEQWNVIASISQRRQVDACHADAIEQISAKGAVNHVFVEIVMRGGEDAYVHLPWTGLSQTRDFFFLKHAEQACLHGDRDVSDLIKEQGPAVSRFE